MCNWPMWAVKYGRKQRIIIMFDRINVHSIILKDVRSTEYLIMNKLYLRPTLNICPTQCRWIYKSIDLCVFGYRQTWIQGTTIKVFVLQHQCFFLSIHFNKVTFIITFIQCLYDWCLCSKLPYWNLVSLKL